MILEKTACLRMWAAFVSFLVLLGSQFSLAGEVDIPIAKNLTEIGRISRQQNIPVIIFVSREACPYCRILRDTTLMPMLKANKFERRAILTEVNMDQVETLTGFDSRQMTAEAFGELYQAGITPTLLFLDSEGREVSKRLIGISNQELYGHYLQKSIDNALLTIRSGIPGG